MQVILLERIKNLGDLGDTVKVAAGYGRNFLLPQGKALPANEQNRGVFEQRKAELVKKANDSLNAARARAEALADKSLTVSVRASDEGKLYGSVGPAEIADVAKAQGLDLNKSEIDVVGGPIRATGTYTVAVHLHSEVETSINVEVSDPRQASADEDE
ncbi:MAG: 50S ribosomal protein L9 [Panacagrimonas sp.]